jgi:hypothetical protein
MNECTMFIRKYNKTRKIYIIFQSVSWYNCDCKGTGEFPRDKKWNEQWGWEVLKPGATVVYMKQKWGLVLIIISHENALRRFCWLPSGRSNNQHWRGGGGCKTGGESNADGWGGGKRWGHFYILLYKEVMHSHNIAKTLFAVHSLVFVRCRMKANVPHKLDTSVRKRS